MKSRDVFTLLGDIKPFRSVGILVLASEELPEDGVIPDERREGQEGLSLGGCGVEVRAQNHARFLYSFGFDMPPRQIVLQHPNEAFLRVIDLLRAAMAL